MNTPQPLGKQRAGCKPLNGHMKYTPHKNPLEITCCECGKDITLDAVYIWKSRVYCEDCNYQDGRDEEDQD